MTYKQHIQHLLQRNDWEIIEIGSGLFWWDLEHWKICRYAQSELVICFMGDPLSENRVQEVRLSIQFPERRDEQGAIASIDLQNGRFDEQLKLFEDQLVRFK
ncbi:hypothetical protein H9Y05_04115 [Crocinitomicaceae bacterium CZZ-1]|uniref:Uncharacterized protein n=1 Tax=Taishania pollutisoli TaxID=2766479 RepID=A0A8J6PHK9_9FLAO|nr:hypothetical protein [Taishania pollutisoli]MBC9811654.1 hypothetical protein [Taishania pollutisoli]NGF75509.1 hypothetical protein [Fluviicola sp. SGL-29]